MHIFRLAKKIINKSRHRSDAGFTLAEILVAVAIVGILVAVSVPVFSGVMEKANEKADAKVMEAAKAATSAAIVAKTVELGENYTFDANTGALVTTAVSGYGKSSEHKGKCIQCIITEDGNSVVRWGIDGILTNGSFTMGSNTYSNPMTYLSAIRASLTEVKAIKIDSTSLNGTNLGKINDYLKSQFQLINIKAWRISKENNKYYTMVTDVDIAKVNTNTWVRVIRYDPRTETYTAAYVHVDSISYTNDQNQSATYNILDYLDNNNKFDSSKYVQISAANSGSSNQTDSTQSSYEATLAIFNRATPTLKQ